MRKINKDIPVVVLQALKEFMVSLTPSRNRLFKIDRVPQDLLFRMIDVDPDSNCFFNIVKFDSKQGLLVNYKPQSKINTDQTTAWVEPDKVSVYFKIWQDCLASYDDVGDFEWIYEDPNLSTFANEFLNDLSLDEETKHEPLTLRQMLCLDEFLNNVESEIVNHENVENAEDIATIVEETQYLRSQLGKQSKEWIAKKLSNVLAKIRREGPTVFKSVFKEIGKQVISQGVKFLFEHPDKLLG